MSKLVEVNVSDSKQGVSLSIIHSVKLLPKEIQGRSFMDEKKAMLWQQRIQACMSSGLSVNRWCKENHVSSPSFYYWKNRLEKVQEETSVKTMPVFVEVTPTIPLQTDNLRSSLHITWNEMHFDITSKEDADLAAYFIRQVQHPC